MKSRMVFFPERGKAEMGEIEVPEPGAGEILVKNAGCGVCQWENKIFLGTNAAYLAAMKAEADFPVTRLGHEGVGRVVAVGPGVTDFNAGDLVATLYGAAFWEYNSLPATMACKLPEMPDDQLRYYISEPAACALNGAAAAAITPGQRVLLLGSGYMGLLLVQLLRQTLAGEVVVADMEANKLALARSLGATTTVNVRETDLAALSEETGRFDVVIEATGAADMIAHAASYCRVRGRLLVFADHHNHTETVPWYNFMQDCLTVLFTNPSFSPDFLSTWRIAAAMLVAGRISQRQLITHSLPAEQCQQLMEIAISHSPEYIKGYLSWE